MIATKKFSNKGIAYNVGDKVSASDHDLKRLVYFGLVKDEKAPTQSKEDKSVKTRKTK